MPVSKKGKSTRSKKSVDTSSYNESDKNISVQYSWEKKEAEQLRQEILIIGSFQVFIGMFGLLLSKGFVNSDFIMFNVQPALVALLGVLLLIIGLWKKEH